MAGQDDAQAAGAAAPGAQAAPMRFSFLRMIALAFGALGWVIIAGGVLSGNPGRMFGFYTVQIVLAPLAWAVPLMVLLLRAGRGTQALSVLVLFPLALFVNAVMFSLVNSSMAVEIFFTLLAAAGWLMLGLARYRVMMDAPGTATRGLRKAVSFVEILLAIVLLGTIASFSMPTYPDYDSPRMRVYELILAASSAKTALSEGMQTYGSWSPEWVSQITISSTGMVRSASIGPQGTITVYGTKPTSFSVVTMIPLVTTDNKLVWSCTGSPARYMPASCR